jgi:hypothetical protein
MCSCDSQASSQASQNTRAERTFVKHCRKSQWSQEEDDLLTRMMAGQSAVQWDEVKQSLPSKTRNQIYQRWSYVLNPGLRKGSWTVEEDRLIVEWVRAHGPTEWIRFVRTKLPHRSPKQCRERWKNQLEAPEQQREWSEADDARLVQLHKHFGNRWSHIAALMADRTANQVKNRWYSTVSRRIERISRGEEPDLKRGRRKGPPPQETKIDTLSPAGWPIIDELFEKDLVMDFDPRLMEDVKLSPPMAGCPLFKNQSLPWEETIE